MKHKISIRFLERSPQNIAIARHIRACITAALQAENMPVPCEINVLVTNDAGIREINRATREIDKPTDVLSFPMFSFVPANCRTIFRRSWIPLQAFCLWVIWPFRWNGQSAGPGVRPFGQTGDRISDCSSILHLLGYDHMDEGEQKRQMRAREEQILADIVLPR